MKKNTFYLLSLILTIFFSCSENKKNSNKSKEDKLAGDLIIFHAGSLSVPMKGLVAEFNKIYPDIKVLLEPAGSLECARKITELQKPCDVFASSDYKVITQMLIPAFTNWYISFAANEMVIAYNDNSRNAEQITPGNWYQLLLNKDISFGRADPNTDPCGYRSVLTMKLAEKHYKQTGLAEKMLEKDLCNIRPKEVDLLALLESGAIDYIFIYRSVAIQHKLNFITLPVEINLSDIKYESFYNTVSCEINGKKPGEKIVQKGDPMIYGITIPKNSPNREAALAFVSFLLDKSKGGKIFEANGQPLLQPMKNETFENIPASLKPFAKK